MRINLCSGMGVSIRHGLLAAIIACVFGAAGANGDERAEEGRLAIDVRIADTEGMPLEHPSMVTIWERLEEGAAVEPRDYVWRNPGDGTVWRRVTGSRAGERGPTRNGKDRFLTRNFLRPGVYRVAAFIGLRREQMVGIAVSDPVRLDGSEEIVRVDVALQDGPPVSFTVLDEATGQPIDHPRPGIVLTRSDGLDVEWNPLNPRLFPGDDGKYRIEHLAPGTYQVAVSAKSYSYGYPDYGDGMPLEIEVRSGKANEFVLRVPARPIDEAEAEKRWPWAVEGVVTDLHGKPLPGVDVRVARGWGTLRNTMPVQSDSEGRYLLRFGPGMMTKNVKTGKWGAGVQAATVSARKAGYAEKDLGRQGGLLMADEMPEDDSRWDRAKIVLPGKPYRVDFTMIPVATLEGQLLDEAGEPLAEKRLYLDGDELPPSTSVAGSATTDADGRFRFDRVTPGFDRWIELSNAKEFALPRTQSFMFEKGQAYGFVLRVTSSGGAGKMLRVIRASNADGKDVLNAVLGDDPRARPFVDDETAAKAREILDRVAEANHCWFTLPSKDVAGITDVVVNGQPTKPMADSGD